MAVIAGIAYVAFKLAPDWFADTKGLTTAEARMSARQGVRTASLAFFAGVIAVVGSIYTARTFGLSRAGQLTDRFTKAVGQLGEDKIDVRLGGIYALERIAHDSKDDHPQVIEVLTAFVRTHAPLPRSTNRQPSDHATAPSSVILPTGVDPSTQHSTAPGEEPRSPDPDVQAALTVIGRRKLSHERKTRPPLLLPFTDLRKVDLSGAHLERATLWYAQLEMADLSYAHLERASLSYAHLEQAYLWRAHLEEATLSYAHLEGAYLLAAHLEGAYLADAHLERAYLADAHLERASLADAHLERANLVDAHLEGTILSGARYDAQTQWPDGYDPAAEGAIGEAAEGVARTGDDPAQ